MVSLCNILKEIRVYQDLGVNLEVSQDICGIAFFCKFNSFNMYFTFQYFNNNQDPVCTS